MADMNVVVRRCNGCGVPLSEKEEGMKVVRGFIKPNPPSRLLDYCPHCEVPHVSALAKLRPDHVIQSVEFVFSDEYVLFWKGDVMFDAGEHCYKNKYGKILTAAQV